MLDVNIAVDFNWQSIGLISLDPFGKLFFPKTASSAGLYRFDFAYADNPATYIGETDQLARRLQHYRTPGPSQKTNIRLNEALRGALENNMAVTLLVVTAVQGTSVAGKSHQIDLSRKLDRVLLEHAAILAARTGGLVIMNA